MNSSISFSVKNWTRLRPWQLSSCVQMAHVILRLAGDDIEILPLCTKIHGYYLLQYGGSSKINSPLKRLRIKIPVLH